MIKELILKRIKEREQRHSDYIRASEIGNCPLSVALRLKGITPKVEDDKLLIFEIGNAVHTNIQKVLEDVLEDVEKEFIDDNLQITGHIDGRIEDKIIEFKSISPSAIKKGNLPYSHHIEQATIYMYLTGLKKALIVYLDKTYGNILEYEIEFDKQLFEKLKEKIGYIRELSEKDIDELSNLTKEELGIQDWQCNYCMQKLNCPVLKKELT